MKDIEDHPEEWKYAPILVSTNTERLGISRMKACMWAKEHKTYVFKWACSTRGFVNRPQADTMSELKEDNAFFWQFFVPGVDAYLNHNINGDIALVNASQLKTHSLTLANEKKYQDVLRYIEDQNIPFGSEIEIDPPVAVNMIVVQELDGKPLSTRRKKQMAKLQTFSRQYNIDSKSRDIIIPLTPSMMPSSDDSWNKYTFCTGNTLAPIAQVKVKEKFPFDLAFSMTVHKAQGRTIKRVVVDLTDHPYPICRMKYAAVFVATSRIKKSKHIRLLEPITVQNRKKLYEYLPTLIPDPSIAPFLHGYSADGCPWDPNRALSYKTQN